MSNLSMRQTEIQLFEKFALDKTGEYVEYEDYVAKLVEENERHLEMLLQDYYDMIEKKYKWVFNRMWKDLIHQSNLEFKIWASMFPPSLEVLFYVTSIYGRILTFNQTIIVQT